VLVPGLARNKRSAAATDLAVAAAVRLAVEASRYHEPDENRHGSRSEPDFRREWS
jgi:hypothetical protein